MEQHSGLGNKKQFKSSPILYTQRCVKCNKFIIYTTLCKCNVVYIILFLNLNCTKSKEIVFRTRVSRRSSEQLPPPCQSIERVEKLTVLGIAINARLTATDHVSGLLTSCSSLLYMLRILCSHGISDTSLQDVFHSTVLAKLTYCSPAWSGYCTVADVGRLDSFLRTCRRLGYCERSQPSA